MSHIDLLSSVTNYLKEKKSKIRIEFAPLPKLRGRTKTLKTPDRNAL